MKEQGWGCVLDKPEVNETPMQQFTIEAIKDKENTLKFVNVQNDNYLMNY